MSKDTCCLHCPKGMLWLWTLWSAWFVSGAFGVPTYGGFWPWLVFLSGLCTYICASDKKHKKSNCPFATLSPSFGLVIGLIGAWFLLGDLAILPTFGLDLLYTVVFALSLLFALNK